MLVRLLGNSSITSRMMRHSVCSPYQIILVPPLADFLSRLVECGLVQEVVLKTGGSVEKELRATLENEHQGNAMLMN